MLVIFFSDGVVLFRAAHLNNKFEENSAKYSGKATADDIKDFITENL